MDFRKAKQEEIDDAELRPLLDRLHGIDSLLAETTLRIQDVAEAMGKSEDEVRRELHNLREDRRTAHLQAVMNELEEPLYRVERPSTQPLKTQLDITLRGRAIETILDKMALKGPPKTAKKMVEQPNQYGPTWAILILSSIGMIVYYALTK